MEYHGNFSAASRQAEKVDVRYMYVPGIGATLTAAPRDHWSTEKAGNAAEVEEYSQEMAQLLFEQLTPYNQHKIIVMLMELANDTGAAEAARD